MRRADGPLLVTHVSGDCAPLAPAAARSLLWRYRWFTAMVIARIHWQALQLWRKRVPFFRKPAPPTSLADPQLMTSLDTSLPYSRARPPAAARFLLALLTRLDVGRVELTTPDGVLHAFGPGGAPAPNARNAPAVLTFNDWDIAGEALKGGDVAFAEAFMAGRWDTPDLTQLLTVLAANQAALEHAFYGHWWTRSLLRLKHFLNANTKRQARRNIHAHYDLGNAFYRLWLDPTMTYSSALFTRRVRRAAGRGAAGEVRPHAGRAGAARPAPACWRSAAAGAASPRPRHAPDTT